MPNHKNYVTKRQALNIQRQLHAFATKLCAMQATGLATQLGIARELGLIETLLRDAAKGIKR